METVEYQNSSEKSSSISIKGNWNIFGWGNIVKTTNIFKEIKDKDHFFTPQEPPVLFNPNLLNDIIKRINRTRMVVLWGNLASRNDKNQFARALGYKLKADNEELKIQEWLKNTDVPDVPIFLNDAKSGIYILTDITPQIVHYDLCKILEVVRRKSHFLIITTNEHFDYWKRLTKTEDLLTLFHELSSKQLYDDEYLALNLVDLLYRERKSLPHEILREYIESYEAQKETRNNLKELVDSLLSKNRSIKNVAEKMGSYDDIDRFVRFLNEDENRVLSDNLIDGIIFKITSIDNEFTKWYYNDLEKRDRQLLLGMTLFSGLYENQLFVAIEELVENEWRIREPVLDAFDYEELDKLRNYAVDIIETGEVERKIEIKPSRRRIIFSECWDTQQRLIVGSIQGMMNIVKNSIYKQSLLNRQPEVKIAEESIEKLRQLDVPQYILVSIYILKTNYKRSEYGTHHYYR